jgi:sulfate transport system substrate-binding protein
VPLLLLLLGLVVPGLCGCSRGGTSVRLLHVSYDPTRELFQELNPLFADRWQAEHGVRPEIEMSHGGAGRQARAVIDGLPADIVTLGTQPDIDALHRERALLPADWRDRLPERSAPWFSTIVFVVRAGNPRNIRDWADLTREGVEVIMPNPKTSGGARWAWLAAWGAALERTGGSVAEAEAWMGAFVRHIPVLDSGARGATTTFVQNGIGDVLLTWENEAWLVLADSGARDFEIVLPPRSIRAEPPVARVDVNTERRGTTALADAYLAFLYSEEAQRVVARHHYRPTHPSVPAEVGQGSAVELFPVESLGGWGELQPTHFGAGGLFDRLQEAR